MSAIQADLRLSQPRELEAESIHVMREVAAEFERPGLLLESRFTWAIQSAASPSAAIVRPTAWAGEAQTHQHEDREPADGTEHTHAERHVEHAQDARARHVRIASERPHARASASSWAL